MPTTTLRNAVVCVFTLLCVCGCSQKQPSHSPSNSGESAVDISPDAQDVGAPGLSGNSGTTVAGPSADPSQDNPPTQDVGESTKAPLASSGIQGDGELSKRGGFQRGGGGGPAAPPNPEEKAAQEMIDRVGGKATRLAGTPGGPGALGIFEMPGDKATEADLDVLKRLPSLFDLTLTGPAFGDTTAPHILQCATLATLRLRGTSFTDKIVQDLLPHPTIRILILDDTAIGSAGFAALGKSQTIEYLDVIHMTLPPEAFVGLKELRGFREIRFRDCAVDEAEVKKLQELLPECDVVVETTGDKKAKG